MGLSVRMQTPDLGWTAREIPGRPSETEVLGERSGAGRPDQQAEGESVSLLQILFARATTCLSVQHTLNLTDHGWQCKIRKRRQRRHGRGLWIAEPDSHACWGVWFKHSCRRVQDLLGRGHDTSGPRTTETPTTSRPRCESGIDSVGPTRRPYVGVLS